MTANTIPEPQFAVGNTVHGTHYGDFAVTGRRWSEPVGEYIYGLIQIDANGNKISDEIQIVESCLRAEAKGAK